MRMPMLIVLGPLSSNLLAAQSQPMTGTFTQVVDFPTPAEKIRALNGVNNRPFVDGNPPADMNARHKEAACPSVRQHDCHWPNPNVVDNPLFL